MNILIYDELESTNTYLKDMVRQGKCIGDEIVVARSQTKGKGRLGRSFISPKDDGIYMSILIKPQIDYDEIIKITSLTAVAVCDAIKEAVGVDTLIKWVNDIYIKKEDGEYRKCAGILAEAVCVGGNAKPDYVIVGIGINVFKPENGYDESIKDIAGALLDAVKLDKRQTCDKLINLVAKKFYDYYEQLVKGNDETLIAKYREKNLVIGKEVTLYSAGDYGKKDAGHKVVVTGIDDRCRIIIKEKDGIERIVNSGEVGIKIR